MPLFRMLTSQKKAEEDIYMGEDGRPRNVLQELVKSLAEGGDDEEDDKLVVLE